METSGDRGQCVVEIAVILIVFAAIWLSFNQVAGVSRSFFKNSTLSQERK